MLSAFPMPPRCIPFLTLSFQLLDALHCFCPRRPHQNGAKCIFPRHQFITPVCFGSVFNLLANKNARQRPYKTFCRMPIYCAKANNSSGCEGGDPSAVYVTSFAHCLSVTSCAGTSSRIAAAWSMKRAQTTRPSTAIARRSTCAVTAVTVTASASPSTSTQCTRFRSSVKSLASLKCLRKFPLAVLSLALFASPKPSHRTPAACSRTQPDA